MRSFRLVEGMYYWGNQKPSQSFLDKLTRAVTEQIPTLITSIPTQKITSLMELRFDPYDGMIDNTVYNPSRPNRVAMALEEKRGDAFIICHFRVEWTPVVDNNNETIFPWQDVSDIALTFRILIEKSEAQKLNFLLPKLLDRYEKKRNRIGKSKYQNKK